MELSVYNYGKSKIIKLSPDLLALYHIDDKVEISLHHNHIVIQTRQRFNPEIKNKL